MAHHETLLIIFIAYGILYFLGYYTKSFFPVIAAGIIALGTINHMDLFSINLLNYTFMILLGLGTIYHGIFLIRENKKKNGR